MSPEHAVNGISLAASAAAVHRYPPTASKPRFCSRRSDLFRSFSFMNVSAMDVMRRWLLLISNFSVAVSLLVMLAALARWLRSYIVTDTVTCFETSTSRYWFATSGLGRAEVLLMTNL